VFDSPLSGFPGFYEGRATAIGLFVFAMTMSAHPPMLTMKAMVRSKPMQKIGE
jgi:hypothetical protein